MKRIRVGIFDRGVPLYRLPVYRRLAREGDLDVTVCAPGPPPAPAEGPAELGFRWVNAPCWRHRPRFPHKWITLQPRLIADVLRGRFDVFVVPNDFGDLSVWFALAAGLLMRRKTCLWGHGFSRRARRLSRWVRRLAIHMARGVVFYSEGTRDAWLRTGLPAEKLFVAANTIDTDAAADIRRRTTAAQLEDFLRRKGWQDRRIALFVGRLLRYKRPEVLVRAMARVCRDVPEAAAVFVGDGPERERLQGLIDELGLADRIFMAGPVFAETELAFLFLSSRVLVMPAAGGLVIPHAFAYGVPVVTGDDMVRQGPEFELLEPGASGYVCPDGDVPQFAARIRELLLDDAQQQRLSANAARAVHERWSIGAMVRGLAEAIRQCARKTTLSARSRQTGRF